MGVFSFSKTGSIKSRPAYRNDIQGLRAILMVQVLLFHAWFIGSPIGVDAFIMISAFLMTTSFLRRTEAGHMPVITERWLNTFKRLLPPLVVVVLATLIGSLVFLPANRWNSLVTQAFASLTYWQNWLLGSLSVDYYAENHSLSSPLQHLWSMSLQGQMFLLWPVVMTLGVLAARKLRISPRASVFLVFTLIAALSLAWLMFFAPVDGSVYFDTRARLWEFAFGSAIAAAAARLRMPRFLRIFLAWFGLAVLILFSLVSIGTYPGPWAFVPMTATAALLLYAGSDDAHDVGKILSWRPLVAVGNISYAVYLIHWPIFVFYLVAVGKDRLGLVEGLLLIFLSLGLSHLLTKYVDNSLNRSVWVNTNSERKIFLVVAALGVGLSTVFTVQVGISRTAEAQERVAAEAARVTPGRDADLALVLENNATTVDETELAAEPLPPLDGFPGAAALFHNGPIQFTTPPIPVPIALEDEWAIYPYRCSDRARELFFIYSQSGCTASNEITDGPGRVLIAGGSHAEQAFMPFLGAFLAENDLQAEAVLKAACHWGMPTDDIGSECRGHNENLLRYVDESPPDYAFLLVTRASADSPEETLVPGVRELIEHLTAKGVTVVGIRDNLRSNTDLFECSSDRDPGLAMGGCILAEADHFAATNPAEVLMDIPGFHFIETTDMYCQNGVCGTIIGNINVYLDTNHVTQSYSNTMAPIFLERLQKSLKEPQ